jgi:hypothetical protein
MILGHAAPGAQREHRPAWRERSRPGKANPGVALETLERSPIAEEDGELVLLRVTIEPRASIPARDEPRAAVILLEEGRIGNAVERAADEANLTLASGNGTVPLTPGSETI